VEGLLSRFVVGHDMRPRRRTRPVLAEATLPLRVNRPTLLRDRTDQKEIMTTQKADFTDIYVQPDPRAYYRTLGALDYEIPEHGCRAFHAVLDALRDRSESPTVLDLCCSYGVNAALLNHDVTLDQVTDHYAEGVGLSRQELIDRDSEWFSARRRSNAVDVIGLDASEAAIAYAVEAGLLVDGVTADLEAASLSESDQSKISDIDLVTVTGGVGYIGDQTFDHVLNALEHPPWVAALSLRWVDFDPVAETLDSHGLVVEKLDDFVVPQRRFADPDEQRFVLDQLASQGLDTTAVEEDGRHGAELYLARPTRDAADASIEELLTEMPELRVAPASVESRGYESRPRGPRRSAY
jgi:SAM-dependent methyltransferase